MASLSLSSTSRPAVSSKWVILALLLRSSDVTRINAVEPALAQA
jgi:hypothetical protein